MSFHVMELLDGSLVEIVIKFHVIVINSDSLVEIDTKFHDYSMTIPCHLSRFYLFSMHKHDMDFGQV